MDISIKRSDFLARPKEGVDVSDLLARPQPDINGKFVEEVELRPTEQARVFLGIFDTAHLPKAFSVTLNPTATEEDVVQQITRLELHNGRHEFILHIANYSNKIVSAEVWRLA